MNQHKFYLKLQPWETNMKMEV